jgi:hypothetical protein
MNKKSLKIPKVQSQAVNGRIDKAMAPKRTNNDIQNIARKTKDKDTLIRLKIVNGLRYYGIITVSGPLVAPVMLLLLQTGDKS